jgi:hypothetical protein
MRLPDFIMRKLERMVDTIPARRAPDFVIGDAETPYLRRWWVIPRNPIFNIYLHQFCRSDDDRALHSHPWAFNASILLRGNYDEHTPKGVTPREAGSLYVRWGAAWHRVELRTYTPIFDGPRPSPVWTLFITGPRVREWGFACPQGFVHWQKFTAPGSGGARTGKGCDQ